MEIWRLIPIKTSVGVISCSNLW